MKKLYRSKKHRMFAGVLGGVADYFNLDPTLVRLVFFIGLVFSVFTLGLVYIGAAFIIPNEEDIY